MPREDYHDMLQITAKITKLLSNGFADAAFCFLVGLGKAVLGVARLLAVCARLLSIGHAGLMQRIDDCLST